MFRIWNCKIWIILVLRLWKSTPSLWGFFGFFSLSFILLSLQNKQYYFLNLRVLCNETVKKSSFVSFHIKPVGRTIIVGGVFKHNYNKNNSLVLSVYYFFLRVSRYEGNHIRHVVNQNVLTLVINKFFQSKHKRWIICSWVQNISFK